MNKIFKLTIFFTIVIFMSCTTKPVQNNINNFLIISIDALHPSAINIKNSPYIFSLLKRGESTLNGKSITPPLTLYNHTAIFTGLSTEESGQKSNNWAEGDRQIQHKTIFTAAHKKGFNTSYFFAKPKLGYLVSDKIIYHKFSGLNSIKDASNYMTHHQNNFTFLHISGLDFSGKSDGWLSKKYLSEFKKIDNELKPLLNKIILNKKFIIIITSDHAGHKKIHGTEHPDDYKIPFIFHSDIKKIKPLKTYKVTDLKKITDNLLK